MRDQSVLEDVILIMGTVRSQESASVRWDTMVSTVTSVTSSWAAAEMVSVRKHSSVSVTQAGEDCSARSQCVLRDVTTSLDTAADLVSAGAELAGRVRPVTSVLRHLGVTMVTALLRVSATVTRDGEVSCVTSLTVLTPVTLVTGIVWSRVSVSAG